MWAEQNVPTMTAEQLEDYNVVLDEVSMTTEDSEGV